MTENKNSQNLDNVPETVTQDEVNVEPKSTSKENTDSNQSVPLATFLKLKDESKELSKRLQEFEASQASQEEAKLKEEGKYKELLEKLEKENSVLKQSAEAYKNLHSVEVESAKEKLGSDWDDEFQHLSIPALRKLSKKVETPLDTDNTKSVADPEKVTLTESEKKEARQMFPYSSPETAYENYFAIKKKRSD